MLLNNDIICHGGYEGKKPVELRAGNLSMIYENGFLRYISSGKTELLRMIYSAVRDRNWCTIDPLIEDEKIEKEGDSFRITLRCIYRSEEIFFSASYLIEGKHDSRILVMMDGEVLEPSEKNRIGFCVLHPVETCAGMNCMIDHTDGSSEQSFFPEEISPYQIFRNIRSMRWLANRISCRINFEGDVFETEDQRNWTDASYKTYSTPLSIPFPVRLEKGTRILQKVGFHAEGHSGTSGVADDKIVVRLFPEETFRLPSIGICQSSRSSPLGDKEIKILRALHIDHYRVDLYLFEINWTIKAEQAFRESSDLGCAIEFALFFDNNTREQADGFIKWYSERRPPVSSILIYHRSLPSTPDLLALEVISLLKSANPEIKTGTGTNANFAELNRHRPSVTGNDYICYSINPQEHASDNTTLVENLKSQEHTVRTARTFASGKGIIISPVTIQRRFNTSHTYVEMPLSGIGSQPQSDKRMMSLFGACWTAGSLKYLCESYVNSITYYETTGDRGIILSEKDSQWYLQTPAERGIILPVYYVFRFLCTNKDFYVMKSISSRPLFVDSFALSDGKQVRSMIVNFTSSEQPVKLDCCSGLFRVRSLNAASYRDAAKNYRWTGSDNEKLVRSHSTFILEPYSVNFIEGWLKH